MKWNTYKRIITLAVLVGGLAISGNNVSAETIDENKLEVSTSLTELQTHNQIHEKGTDNQLLGISSTTMKFIKKIALPAYESGLDNGLYPSVTIAQAVLESGNGASSLSLAPYNNLFGVKGFYNGKSVKMRTFEDDGTGHQFQIFANFKVYPSWHESIRDHDALLRNQMNGFYSGAWRENAKTPEEATQFLQGRYATDTRYASKLNNIINTYNLKRFDNVLDDRDFAWINSESLDPWEKPIVEVKVDKVETWASGFRETPVNLIKRVEALIPIRQSKTLDSSKVDEYYVEQTLGVSNEFTERDTPRYKRNPVIGDIATYTTENGNNEVVTKYAVVEAVEKDTLLISEGVKSSNGVDSIYRVIPNSSLYKFEFISRDGLN